MIFYYNIRHPSINDSANDNAPCMLFSILRMSRASQLAEYIFVHLAGVLHGSVSLWSRHCCGRE